LAKYNYFKNLELKNQLKFGIILGKNWGFLAIFFLVENSFENLIFEFSST
jgi:hypothetical protein